jgi:hypothetical protein
MDLSVRQVVRKKGNSMQMRKSLLIGMVIASLWAATGFVQPVWGQDEGHARRGGMLLRLLYKLDLREDQKAQVKQILASHRPALQSLRDQLHIYREQLADGLMGTSQVTLDQLQSLAKQVTDQQGAIAQEWLKAMYEVRLLLDQDQLVKLAGLKDNLRMLHQEMRTLLKKEQ